MSTVIQSYLRKQEKSKINNPTLDLKQLKKEQRSYPTSEARSGDERSYPRPRPGAVAGRTNPTPWLCGHRRA